MAVDQRLERIGQVADRIDVARLAIGDEAGEQRPVFRADLVSGKECILPSKSNFSDLVFDRVGVQFQAAVPQEPRQAGPVRQGIAYVFGQLGGFRDARELCFKPGAEGLDDRCGEFAPRGEPRMRRGSANRFLDGIELGDLTQCLLSDRRAILFQALHEAPPCMRPAMDERPRPLGSIDLGELVVGVIAVALNELTMITLEEAERMYGPSARGVVEHHDRRVGAAVAAVIRDDGPEKAGLGFSASGIEHRRSCLIHEDPIRAF